MVTITEKTTKKLPGETSLFVSFKYNKDMVEFIKSFTCYSYNNDTKEWELPVTYLSKLIEGFSKFDDCQLNLLEDPKEQPIKNYKLSNFRTPPFKYQLEGIQYGLNHDKFLLLDAPGLGKSLQLIYLAQERKKLDKIKHCLIICGINTLKTNWKKEIELHSDLDCRIVGEHVTKKGQVDYGGIQERLEELKHPIKEFFVILNVETLRDNDVIKQLNNPKNGFDMIIVDEIHKCKSPTSQQGKNLLKLTKAKYCVGATGTLLLNSPLDAYVPLKWLGKDKSNYSTYKFFYCNYVGLFNNVFLGYRNIKILKQQLDHFSLRRTKDLLELPPKTIINEQLDMDTTQRMFYKNIVKGIIDQVDKVELTTTNLLSMVTRLRQATACPHILTTENIPSAKIDRAVELCKEIIDNGDKVVVFSTFKETIKDLYDNLKDYNPLVCTGDTDESEISKSIDKFQTQDDNKIMLATWQKMGTGITLTKANYAIFIDTPWTNAVYEQAQDRIYRIGTQNKVFIYNLIVKNTIDERVLQLVTDKEAISDYIVDNKISSKTVDNLKKYIEDLETT